MNITCDVADACSIQFFLAESTLTWSSLSHFKWTFSEPYWSGAKW